MTDTYIALLRAINVGGANSLPMSDFVRLLRGMGLKNVRTYIQSGNAVFRATGTDAARLSEEIKARIKRSHGFSTDVIVLTLAELGSAVASNPYPEADSDPKALHLTFLASAPSTPDLATLESIRKDSERFTLKGRVFYFYAPEGVGRSKLFARLERPLGVVGTARNWRTVCKILELAHQAAEADMAAGPNAAGSRACVAAVLGLLPEARAVAHGPHLSLEVRRKRFAWYLEDHHGDGRVALHCKSKAAARARLRQEAKEQFHVPKYVGHRGWLGLWLDVPEVDWSLVEATLRDAYRMTAPRALVAKLDEQGGQALGY